MPPAVEFAEAFAVAPASTVAPAVTLTDAFTSAPAFAAIPVTLNAPMTLVTPVKFAATGPITFSEHTAGIGSFGPIFTVPKSTPAPGAVPKYAGPDAVRSPGNAEEKVNPERAGLGTIPICNFPVLIASVDCAIVMQYFYRSLKRPAGQMPKNHS